MRKVIRSHERHHLDHGWLSAHWHFSFDSYYDPENISFGPLRVFNDDTIQPGGGFPPHPHAEMEIVTYVIAGKLEHRDSMGNKGVLGAGDVQRMSAGTGIYHSEINGSPDESLRLCQIWVLPDQRGIAPSYEEAHVGPERRRGVLLPIVSGQGAPGALHIHQDTTFYVSALYPGETVRHTAAPGRRTYLFVISGQVQAGAEVLASGDQLRLIESGPLTLVAEQETELILLDLP